MTAEAVPAPRGRWLPLRFALRELRGGLHGFYVFIACIALGSLAIAGVGSLAASLADGLAREGRVILGGDLAFTLIQREAAPDELSFLKSHGQVSTAATMRAMARTADGQATLVEMKAVDAAYPLFGQALLDPRTPLADALAQRDGAFGAVADSTLMARLDIKSGARLTIGNASIEIRAILSSEPDKLAAGIGFGPRLLVSQEALRATGLLQPGSLVRWHYRLRQPTNSADDAVAQTTEAAKRQFPEAGWEIRSRNNAAPQLERNIERFSQYLTLVGLTALLIGGVGVANSARYFLDRKRNVMAILKSVGATGARVVAIYFVEVLIVAAIGVVIGLAAGAALPFGLAAAFGAISPLPLAPAIYPGQLALASAYGLLTAAMFS